MISEENKSLGELAGGNPPLGGGLRRLEEGWLSGRVTGLQVREGYQSRLKERQRKKGERTFFEETCEGGRTMGGKNVRPSKMPRALRVTRET